MSEIWKKHEGRMVVSLMCEALIDQGRVIGQDPVGYRCSRPATYEILSTGHLICDRCRKLILESPELVTLPIGPHGAEVQKAIICRAFRELLGAPPEFEENDPEPTSIYVPTHERPVKTQA